MSKPWDNGADGRSKEVQGFCGADCAPPVGFEAEGDDHGEECDDCESNGARRKGVLVSGRNSSLAIETWGPDEGFVFLVWRVLFTG